MLKKVFVLKNLLNIKISRSYFHNLISVAFTYEQIENKHD